jgi:pyruvate dehydrogenase E1 component alpha subunit
VYETLNMAALWRVPLVIAVEHNEIAQSTPTSHAMAGTIAGRAAAFGARYRCVHSTSVRQIRAELAPVIDETRAGAGPLVIEFRTVRLGPHSKGDDTRDSAELARLRARDWYERYAEDHPAQFARLDAAQHLRVQRVVDEVLARPLADGMLR